VTPTPHQACLAWPQTPGSREWHQQQQPQQALYHEAEGFSMGNADVSEGGAGCQLFVSLPCVASNFWQKQPAQTQSHSITGLCVNLRAQCEPMLLTKLTLLRSYSQLQHRPATSACLPHLLCCCAACPECRQLLQRCCLVLCCLSCCLLLLQLSTTR
jgi:hypothetical protein